jgi:hypothetical protein
MWAALMGVLAMLAANGGGAPFIMIGNSKDPRILPVLNRYLRAGDYVSQRLAAADPGLGRRLGRDHQFDLPGSLAGVRKHAGCGAGTPGVVVYDIEHWTDTPEAEQRHPGESVAAGARIVRQTGCQVYALAPDGEFMGLKEECGYDFDAGLYDKVDWTQVELVSIQAQRMLSDTCAAKLTVDDYATFVSRVASYVRRRNPAIRVVTQVSFRYTPPEKIVDAMRRAAAVVDGFYVVYPAASVKACKFCSPDNLATVLAARTALR